MGQKRFAMVLRALVTLLVTTAPEALGQPLLPSPLLAVIREDALAAAGWPLPFVGSVDL